MVREQRHQGIYKQLSLDLQVEGIIIFGNVRGRQAGRHPWLRGGGGPDRPAAGAYMLQHLCRKNLCNLIVP